MSGGAAERAFVIQFSVDEDGRASSFSGRVEHVASGESARFGSPAELTSYLCGKLGNPTAAGVRDQAPAGRKENS